MNRIVCIILFFCLVTVNVMGDELFKLPPKIAWDKTLSVDAAVGDNLSESNYINSYSVSDGSTLFTKVYDETHYKWSMKFTKLSSTYDVEWQKKYEIDCSYVFMLPGNQFLCVGNVNNELSFQKIDQLGNILWIKQLSTIFNEHFFSSPDYQFSVTVNGQIVVLDLDSSKKKLHVFRASADGVFVSKSELDCTGMFHTGRLDSFYAAEDGSIVICDRYTITHIDDDRVMTKSSWLKAKAFNPLGGVVWEQVIELGKGEWRSNKNVTLITQTKDNGFLFVLSADVDHSSSHLGSIKLSPDGVLEWYMNTAHAYCELKTVFESDNAIYLGHTVYFPDYMGQMTKGGYDYGVTKLTLSGELVWSRNVGGVADDLLTRCYIGDEQCVYLEGLSESNQSSDKSSDNRDKMNYWVVKLAPEDGATDIAAITSVKFFPERANVGDVVTITVDGVSLSNTMSCSLSKKSYESDALLQSFSSSRLVFQYEAEYVGYYNCALLDKERFLERKDLTYFIYAAGVQSDSVHYGTKPLLKNIPDGGYYFYSKNYNDTFVKKYSESDELIWEKELKTGFLFTDEDYEMTVVDDGFVLAGGTESGARLPLIIKYDSNGIEVWRTVVSGQRLDYDTTSSILTLIGGEILIGYSADSTLSADRYDNDVFYCIKMSSDGQVLWQKTFPYYKNGTFVSSTLSKVVECSNEDIVLAGVTGDGKFLIRRFNSSCTELWSKVYCGGGISYSNSLNDILALDDGSFLLGGTSYDKCGNDKSADHYGGGDYWIIKITETGECLWERSYGGDGADLLKCVVQTSDGGYLLGGVSASSTSKFKREFNYPKNNIDYWDRIGYDCWVVRVDSLGKLLWDKRYGGNRREHFGDLISRVDGSYLFTASVDQQANYYDNIHDDQSLSSLLSYTDHSWLVRLKPETQFLEDIDYLNNQASLELKLSEGYQIISLNFSPEKSTISSVMKYAGDYLLESFTNIAGPVALTEEWKVTEAYVVKMKRPAILRLTSNTPLKTNSIELTKGRNLVPLWSLPSQDPKVVFASILPYVNWIRNSKGQHLRKVNGKWVNSIDKMAFGEGYLVDLSDDCTLMFTP